METLQEKRRDFLLNKLNENNGTKEQINVLISTLKNKILDPETITSQELKNIYNYLTTDETKNSVEGTSVELDKIVKQVAAAYGKVKQYEKEQPKQAEKPKEAPETDGKDESEKTEPEKTANEKPAEENKSTESNNKISIKSEDFYKALNGAGINVNAQNSAKLIQNLAALNITLTE